jgi:NADPH:quinone reductase-like Zn-dependent oxidoreductase
MKAVVINRTGPPDVLEYRDVEDPRPANGEAVVRVAATGVNGSTSGSGQASTQSSCLTS